MKHPKISTSKDVYLPHLRHLLPYSPPSLLPLSLTPSHQHPLTPWQKSLKNRGVFNTLDNSKTPHLHPEKCSTPREHPRNILQHCLKWICKIRNWKTHSYQHAQMDKKLWRVPHPRNLKSFFKHSGTFTDTLSAPQKLSLSLSLSLSTF